MADLQPRRDRRSRGGAAELAPDNAEATTIVVAARVIRTDRLRRVIATPLGDCCESPPACVMTQRLA